MKAQYNTQQEKEVNLTLKESEFKVLQQLCRKANTTTHFLSIGNLYRCEVKAEVDVQNAHNITKILADIGNLVP